MATYQFSALADGQAISFNPDADILNFDQSLISAPRVRATVEGADLRLTMADVGLFTGKDVLLLNVSPLQLTSANFTFLDGGRLLFGDNTTSTIADNAANAIAGGAQPDHLVGFGGNDTLNGGAREDRLDGGDGDDSLIGGDGVDTLIGGAGNDTVQGQEGNDTLEGGAGNDSLMGGAGDDWFVFPGAVNHGQDVVDGGSGFDMLSFELQGGSGIVIDLTAGTLTGGGVGGAGSATVVGIEHVRGTAFADRITSATGGSITGGGGDDTLVGGSFLDGGDGDDELRSTDGNDIITAGSGRDTVFAGAGDDQVFGGAPDSDTFDGGAGRDSVSFGGGVSPMTIDLAAGTATGGNTTGSSVATITAFEDATGGLAGDRLIGTSEANRLDGSAGNDTLIGGGGNDSLTGGVGADRIAFREAGAATADVVTGFVSGSDELFFDSGAFAGLGTAGDFAASDARFAAGAGFTSGRDASDRIVYDTSTGNVYYDADGSGAGGAQLVATLEGRPALSATDVASGVDAPPARPTYDVETIINNGASANRVDIVFLGDGYTASQMGLYHQHTEGLTAFMFQDSLATQPFARYASFFNVHIIDVVSNQSGADHPGTSRDTALHTSYSGSSPIIDNIAATTVVSDAFAGTQLEAEMRFVAVNDFGGGVVSGPFAAYSAAGGAGAYNLALHEAGHQFASLGDQYWTSGTTYSSVEINHHPDLTIDRTGAKWAHWLGYDQPGVGVIGAYEGGFYHEEGVYRPSVNSKMRSVDQPFDAVGREAFILEFYDLVDPLDAYLSNGSTLVDEDELWVDTIDPGVIRVDWTINGTIYVNAGERISLSELGYDDGEFSVTARAYDPTDWVRVADRSDLEQTVQWTVVNDDPASGSVINGTSGSDTLSGTAGNDTINGLGGNDTLVGSGGTDFYDGGAGSDTLDFRVAAAGVSVSFSDGTVSGGFSGTFANIERVLGGNGADIMIGAAGSQTLSGRTGSDWLAGGVGLDALWGGSGGDSFVFRDIGTANADAVSDFASGSDLIVLDASVMSALGTEGHFAAGDARFTANATGTATDASDRVIYETDTRQIWYDADGNGAGAKVLVATLQSGATLVATDIRVLGSSEGGGETINGTAGDDSLSGGEGNDTINGLAGNDTLRGFNGDDLLDGGADVDTMDGGQGNDRHHVTFGDVLVDAGGIDTVVVRDIGWTLGDDFENLEITGAGGTGGTGNDFANRIDASVTTTRVFLDGWGGNDTLIGGSGNDDLSGRHGDDFIVGGDGNDALDPFNTQHGSDTLDGGLGDDGYYVNSAEDVLIDAGGSDTVLANVSWTLAAGFENLRFFNHTGDDNGLPGLEGYGNELANVMQTYGGNGGMLDGRAGNDTLIGGDRAFDQLFGGSGNDVLTGVGTGDRFVFTVAPGAANADQITDFTPGGDKVVLDGAMHANIGGSGDFVAGDARFAANGTGTAQDTSDRVIYSTTTGQLWYDADGSGAGARQLIATLEGAPAIVATDISVINGSAPGSTINGTSGNDTLSGTSGEDTINGLGGNDLVLAGSTGGADVINGGDGRDSIEFKAAATSAVVVDFNAGTISGGSAGGSISFSGIERVVAGNFNDSMSGTVGAQTLAGQAGADTLSGGAGNDTLWGGSGNDAFQFNGMGSANADRISDFVSGQDKVQLEDGAFTAIGAMGNFAAGDARFWASGTGAAHDANDRVTYNTSTGQLYYDADGNGSGAAQLIATLATIPAVAATDIAVI